VRCFCLVFDIEVWIVLVWIDVRACCSRGLHEQTFAFSASGVDAFSAFTRLHPSQGESIFRDVALQLA
jgi:hypothetical protein